MYLPHTKKKHTKREGREVPLADVLADGGGWWDKADMKDSKKG
jgi:hypothetical protein